MKPIYLTEILPYINGEIIGEVKNPLIKHIVRKPKYSALKDHTLFFHSKESLSLKATKHIKDIVIITSNPTLLSYPGKNITIVKVRNTKNAYWRFIDFYRSLLTMPFIAITGTCGKTTTKEMVGWIFSENHSVYKTIKNENDPSRHLDYLLGITKNTDIVVMETAVAVPGHLKKGFRYFKPQIGILTSIGIDHLNGFPDLDSYIREKQSIFSLMEPTGTIVVNIDNEHIQKIDFKKIDKHIITYGMSKEADFRIDQITFADHSMKFTLYHHSKRYRCSVPGLGKHNVYNATAAIAAAHQLGISINDSSERLKSFPILPQHVEIVKGINHSTLIDDTWSSNPTSIESSLDVLANISPGKKKIAVFGEIKYLGNHSKDIHTSVGSMVAKEDIDFLITIGQDAKLISIQAVKLGMNEKQVFPCESPEQAYDLLTRLADPNSVVLVKTSMYQSYKRLVRKLRKN